MSKLAKLFLIILVLVIASICIFLLIQYNKDVSQKESEKNNQDNSQAVLEEQNAYKIEFSLDWECINDSTCDDAYICVNHSCNELNCEFPYYPKNHKCERVQCTNNEECDEDKFCWNLSHVCIKPACDYCEYADSHMCMKYECCIQEECPGKNSDCFYHKCIVSSSELAFETILEGNRRTSYKTIMNYSFLEKFDVGLLLVGNQKELDYVNRNILYLWDNATFDFENYSIVIAMHHGIYPADVKIRKILLSEAVAYFYISTDQGETGFTDDAWQVIAVKKENFAASSIKFDSGEKEEGKGYIFSEMYSEEDILPIAFNYSANQSNCIEIKLKIGEMKTIELMNVLYDIKLNDIGYGGTISPRFYIFVDDVGIPEMTTGDNGTTNKKIRVYPLSTSGWLGICPEE